MNTNETSVILRHPARWPAAGKWLATAFLAIVGFGYLAAVANMFHQHQLADGVPGLSIDDLRAAFHGVEVQDDPGDEASSAPKSRFMEMVEPGGDMRKHLTKGGEPAVRTLEKWLRNGATRENFTKAGIAQEGDPSPADVVASNCLRCHNADGGEKADTPYGEDLFDVDYDMIFVYAAPGTAKQTTEATPGEPRTIGPNSEAHLFLVTHIHMLSIPVFTLIVSALFLLTGNCRGIRGLLTVAPMFSLCVDFSSWWLARWAEGFIYAIAAAGAVFGATFGLQILSVTWAIWFGRPGDGTPVHSR